MTSFENLYNKQDCFCSSVFLFLEFNCQEEFIENLIRRRTYLEGTIFDWQNVAVRFHESHRIYAAGMDSACFLGQVFLFTNFRIVEKMHFKPFWRIESSICYFHRFVRIKLFTKFTKAQILKRIASSFFVFRNSALKKIHFFFKTGLNILFSV